MAFLGQTYNTNSMPPPSEDYTPLPSGEYPAIITDSEMKPTKKGNGQYLELSYQVIDGPFKGRLVWARLNLDNPSTKAVEIANRDLASILTACGLAGREVPDSQALHNIPHVIRVEHTEAGKNGMDKDGNEVKAWKRIEGAAPQAQQAAPPAAPQQQAAPAPAGNPPNWMKKSA